MKRGRPKKNEAPVRVYLSLSQEDARLLDAVRNGKTRATWALDALRKELDRHTLNICPRCEGDGEEWDGSDEMKPCPLCGGAGQVREVAGRIEKIRTA